MTVSDSTFAENIAEVGGTIYLSKYSEKFESNNCTFKNNKPDDVCKDED